MTTQQKIRKFSIITLTLLLTLTILSQTLTTTTQISPQSPLLTLTLNTSMKTYTVRQPIGYAETTVTIGGATYCSYYNLTETLTIYIPEWARAGYAYIHVNIFDKDPAEGGSPWCPEYVTEIYILPEP